MDQMTKKWLTLPLCGILPFPVVVFFLFHKKRIAMLCVLHNGFTLIFAHTVSLHFLLYHRIIPISTKVYFTQPKSKTIILVLSFIVFFDFTGAV